MYSGDMPPDLAGMPKPPCAGCGKPSICWVVNQRTGKRVRACYDCCSQIVKEAVLSGHTATIIQPGKQGYKETEIRKKKE